MSAITFRADGDLDESSVRDLVRSVFERVAGSAKRVRERDLPVFFGGFSHPEAGDFLTLCLPERLLVDIHYLFQDAIREIGSIEGISRQTRRDVEAQPFGRYLAGEFIFYTDPIEAVPEKGKDLWEWRSYAFATPIRKQASRTPLPPIDFEASRFHSLNSWVRLAPLISRVILEMQAPSSYRALRKAVARHFGLQVRELSDVDFPHYGALGAGWLGPEGCEVTISLRASLPAELKYIVLAHELAHFVRHFPLIYANQFAEQASWLVPEFEPLYRQLVASILGERSRIENDANVFATYLLLPPHFDLEAMASMMLENGRPVRPEELGWRLLQSLFPDGALNEGSWAELEELRPRIARDLSMPQELDPSDSETLYLTMLRSLLVRNQAASWAEIESIGEDLQVLYGRVEELAQEIFEGDRKIDQGDSEEHLPYEELSSDRRVLEPLAAAGDARMPHRVPLAPTTGNRDRDPAGKWRSPLLPSHRGRSVRAWRELYPRHSIVVYPFQRPAPRAAQDG